MVENKQKKIAAKEEEAEKKKMHKHSVHRTFRKSRQRHRRCAHLPDHHSRKEKKKKNCLGTLFRTPLLFRDKARGENTRHLLLPL